MVAEWRKKTYIYIKKSKTIKKIEKRWKFELIWQKHCGDRQMKLNGKQNGSITFIEKSRITGDMFIWSLYIYYFFVIFPWDTFIWGDMIIRYVRVYGMIQSQPNYL